MHLCYRTLFISSELFLFGFLIQEVWFLCPFPITFSLKSSSEGTEVRLSSYSHHSKVARGMSWDLLKVSMLALGCSCASGQLCLAECKTISSSPASGLWWLLESLETSFLFFPFPGDLRAEHQRYSWPWQQCMGVAQKGVCKRKTYLSRPQE